VCSSDLDADKPLMSCAVLKMFKKNKKSFDTNSQL